MKRHLTNLTLAAVITAISAAGAYALTHSMGPRWLGVLAFTPALPAFFASFPFGGGPDGNPRDPGPVVFILTFLFWWFVMDRVSRWRRHRDARTTQGSPRRNG